MRAARLSRDARDAERSKTMRKSLFGPMALFCGCVFMAPQAWANDGPGRAPWSASLLVFATESSAAAHGRDGEVPLNWRWASPFMAPAHSITAELYSDEGGIAYVTPRVSGFQLGLSSLPATSGKSDDAVPPALGSETSGDQQLFTLGANFYESFDDFDLALTAGYRPRDAKADGLNPARSGAPGRKDPDQWSAGMNLGYGGFTVGGSFALEDLDRPSDGWAADAGVSYSHGPWSASFTAFFSRVEGATADAGDDDQLAFMGALSYAVWPGIETGASLFYSERHDDSSGATEDVTGIIGLRIGF